MNAIEQEAIAARLQREAFRRLRKWQACDDWEDILGEAYLEAWRAYTQSSARPSTRDPLGVAIKALECGPAQWLRRRNGRSRQPQRALSLDQIMEEQPTTLRPLIEPDFSEGLLTQMMAEQMPALLQQLPELDRQVIALHFGEELTYVQAARVLGCTAETFRHRMQRALDRCRVLLGLKAAPAGLDRCRAGHPWSEATLIINSRGARVCRLCRQAAIRRYEARKTARERAERVARRAAAADAPAASRTPRSRPAYRSPEANRVYMREYRRKQKEGEC